MWDTESLKRMIQKRVVFSLQCSESDVWNGLFPENTLNEFLRASRDKPRELIRLAALSIEEARNQGRKRIAEEDVKAAIRAFSEEKIEELGSEWGYRYRSIDALARRFSGRPKQFSLTKLKELAFEIAYEIETQGRDATKFAWAHGFMSDPNGFAKVLADVGFLLVKASRTAEPRQLNIYDHEEISDEMWFAIHPMYAAALGLVGAT